MSQLHRKFSDDQVRAFFHSYCQGTLARTAIQEVLEIGKTRFFTLLKTYRQNPDEFSLKYQRSSPAKLSNDAEEKIERALLDKKRIVEDPNLPISGYNTQLFVIVLEIMVSMCLSPSSLNEQSTMIVINPEKREEIMTEKS